MACPSKSSPHTSRQQLEFGDPFAEVAEQCLEQGVLAAGQLDRDVATATRAVDRVQRQIPGDELTRSGAGIPSGEGPEPSHEDHERERLRQEVVGAGIERLGFVVLAGLGGEHQDRCPDALRAQRLADLVAVHAGQEDVEHDRPVGAFVGSPQTVDSVVAQLDVETFVVQTFGDRLSEPDVVLDH